jgi:DNA polymerase-3 subunit epsilon
MNLWKRLFGKPQVALAPEQQARLDAWRALPPPPPVPLEQSRILVVDLESTGLDVQRDRPLSIGAVAVEKSRIQFDQLFLRMLHQEPGSGANDAVLIHGISPTQTDQGMDPADALLDFLEFTARSPLVAYHAPFDRELTRNEARRRLGIALDLPWLDLAWLLPALFPEPRLIHAPLDAWLDHFHLHVPDRHRADVDALMTAELLLICLAQVRSRGLARFEDIHELARLHAARHATVAGI